MMDKFSFVKLLWISLCVIFLSGNGSNQEKVKPIPDYILDDGIKNECDPIKFIENQAGNSYVLGLFSELPEKESGAYWCKRRKGLRVIRIYINKNSIEAKKFDHEILGCKMEISGILNPPTGLNLYRNERLSLGNFYEIDDPKKMGPKEIYMKNNGITNGFEEGDFLYCHDQKWYYLVLH